MGRSWNITHLSIIFRALVFIGYLQSYGCTKSFTMFSTRQDNDLIRFLPICGQGTLAGASSGELRLYILFSKG